jgi:3,4-dihydroxy-2-butanone 4-phosphate synthase
MPTRTKQVKQDWQKLEPGDPVIVIDDHDHELPGIVVAKTAVSEVIWIMDQKAGDAAIDHREGIT